MVTRTTAWYSVGDVFKVTVTVTATTSATPTDSDPTFIVNTPSGGSTVKATTLSTQGGSGITRESTGVYSITHLTTEAGEYLWAFRSTGNVSASTGGYVAVRALPASS